MLVFPIMQSLAIHLNVLMIMSILGFQFHMFFVAKSITIGSLKEQIKLLDYHALSYLHIPKKSKIELIMLLCTYCLSTLLKLGTLTALLLLEYAAEARNPYSITTA